MLKALRDELGRIYGLFIASSKTWRSYSSASIFYFVNTIIGAVIYAFLGEVVYYSGALSKYGTVDYLAYLIVGMAFFTYLHESLDLASRLTDPWRLEHQLITPLRLPVLLIGSSIWTYTLNTIAIGIYLGMGFLFSVRFNANGILFVFLAVLSIIIMWGFGMLAAGIQIISKQWNPVTWLLSTLTMLVGGVYFPPDILPPPLKTFSQILPQYYLLDLFRAALLLNSSIHEVWRELLILTILAVIVFPLGYFGLKKGIDKARRDGTLGHF